MNFKDELKMLDIPQKTVAKLAGASYADVSWFIESPDSVAPAKRARIQETIENLVYVVSEVFPKVEAEIGVRPDIRHIPSLRVLLDDVQKGKAATKEAEDKFKQQEKETLAAIDALGNRS